MWFLRSATCGICQRTPALLKALKGGDDMNMQEVARMILWLQAKGWSGDEINKFLLYIESGEAKYFPTSEEKTD